MTDQSGLQQLTMYETEVQCDECLEHFGVTFDDPSETFSGTCPTCGAHYPELYV